MNKKGFTLIELLAVIIILGILMIIAIPSVTKYISDSRKNAYVDTAKEIVSGTRNKVNDGKLGMFDTNATYYIPSSYIKTENASKSPYGEFTEAYIAVIYDGKVYKYYWISVDDAGQGVKNITPVDKLDTDDIESDLTSEMIKNTVEHTVIGDRNKILILDPSDETWKEPVGEITTHASEEEGGGASGGEEIVPPEPVCIPATTLHKVTCGKSVPYGCNAAGQPGYTKRITYGTLVDGTPKPGDAYDCDVNNNGVIDTDSIGNSTERFYYIKSSGENTILIYYKNYKSNGNYDSNGVNWLGPRTAINYLPDTTKWNNPGLIAPGTRQIVAENGSRSTSGGTIENFTYTNRAARLLTSQELVEACSSLSTVGNGIEGELDGCIWLLENVDLYEQMNGMKGYWLETPSSSKSDSVYYLNGEYRSVYTYLTNYGNKIGIRPVITVLTSNILNQIE